MQNIHPIQLKEIMNEQSNFLVIDVRSNAEHFGSNISNVHNIPMQEIENHINELKKYDTVYIHCESGSRSTKTIEKLTLLGLTNLVNVSGGIQEWKKQGFDINENKKLPIIRQVMIVAGSLVFFGSTLGFVNSLFGLLPLAVGLGLFYAGASGNCMMATILSYAPWNKTLKPILPWSSK